MNPTADAKKTKGVIADSALYDISGFDFIWSLAIDIFHLCFEGISKTMLIRMLVLKTSKEAKQLLADITLLYQGTRVFTETARKTRLLQVKKLKGNELAVLTLSIFPAIIYNIIEGDNNHRYWPKTGLLLINIYIREIFYRKNVRIAMATYTFLLRAYFYDDDTLEKTENALMQATGMTLKYLHRVLYNSFQKGFCKKGTDKEKAQRPTINVHVFQHLLESRKKSGPVHLTTTEPFEAFYSVLRRCYRAGTKNTTKQAFENFYIGEK